MGFIKKIGKIICFITLIFLLTYMVINLSLNNILSKIESTLGNYAITGNHDIKQLKSYKKI